MGQKVSDFHTIFDSCCFSIAIILKLQQLIIVIKQKCKANVMYITPV